MKRTLCNLWVLGTLSAALVASSACAPKLEASDNGVVEPDPQPDGEPSMMGIPDNPNIDHSENSDGSFTTRVDASDTEAWRYLDLETLLQVEPAVPEDSPEWDIGFQRFMIKTNGGISGRGGVQVARLPGQDYDSLRVAPTAVEYVTDNDDTEADEDFDPDLAFLVDGAWYTYDAVNHILTPVDAVYVVKTVEGNYFKVKILGYYDDAGSSGFIRFRWEQINDPDGSDIDPDEGLGEGTLINANGGTVYLSLSEGGLVQIAEPASDETWDLALTRFMIATNSGTSGNGKAGGMLSDKDYDTVTSAPTIGHLIDDDLEIEGAHPGAGTFSGHPVLANWYDYDVETHILTTQNEVFLVRSGKGDGYFKLQITGYNNGRYTLQMAPLDREVNTETAEVSVSDGPVYFNLRTGQLVAPDDPTTSLDWDMAFVDGALRTNGGASGAGQGAALDAGTDDLAMISGAPSNGFVEDAEAGNEALAAALDAGVPTGRAFVVRAADGSVAKLQITSATDGQIGFSWAYAGPAHTTF